MQQSNANFYLYKILSQQDWQESQKLGYAKPLENDTDFVHLSEKDQIDRIVTKFWANRSDVVVVKIDPQKMLGKLVHEANPGGTTKYYHLYNGKIPLAAVVESYPYKNT